MLANRIVRGSTGSISLNACDELNKIIDGSPFDIHGVSGYCSGSLQADRFGRRVEHVFLEPNQNGDREPHKRRDYALC